MNIAPQQVQMDFLVSSTHHNDEQSYRPSLLPTFRQGSVKIAGRELVTTPVFDLYWYFATARQAIFHARVRRGNLEPPFDCDPILSRYRFTNAYRASDRVSQYLIRNVIDETSAWSDASLFLRILLFKIFNKIDTWEEIEAIIGPVSEDSFDRAKIDSILTQRQNSGKTNYSAAYIMPSAGRVFGHQRKHSNHLALVEKLIRDRFYVKLSDCRTMEQAYDLMASVPSFGPFLAYQFVTDLNYSRITGFREDEFVRAGPGAHDGVSKCFKSTEGLSSEDIIKFMYEHQDEYFDKLDLGFEDLWGRPLQLIDCQNLFCEVSKYSRRSNPEIKGVLGRNRIKQTYRANPKPIPLPLYPTKWGLKVTVA